MTCTHLVTSENVYHSYEKSLTTNKNYLQMLLLFESSARTLEWSSQLRNGQK